MKIKIENIGMLKRADVNINGLTVVAGVNDTGKSTLGKLLFSTIKADNIRRQQKKVAAYLRAATCKYCIKFTCPYRQLP